jgi:hypothetical protein
MKLNPELNLEPIPAIVRRKNPQITFEKPCDGAVAVVIQIKEGIAAFYTCDDGIEALKLPVEDLELTTRADMTISQSSIIRAIKEQRGLL